MISRYEINNSLWVNLNSPTLEEIAAITAEFGLEPSMTKELETPTPKPRAYESSKFLYAIFHIPVFKHSHREEVQEIDFCMSRHLLITARYDSIDALHKFEKEAEVLGILGKNGPNHNHPFFHIMQEIQKSLFDELFYIGDWISSIEGKIFKGLEKEMVIVISEASKNLLNFRKAIQPHKDTLEFLKIEGGKRFGPAFDEGMDLLLENWRRINEISANHLEMLRELRETNNSLLSTKQNEVMQMLTAIASIILPISIIASIFGMSVHMPIADTPNSFWIIIGLMFIVSICMFTIFKIKKWL